MATSTYKSFLMKGNTSGSTTTWEKLIDIKDYPDLGGEPEMIPSTTLSDGIETNVVGVQTLGSLSFTANYDLADYTALKALEGTEGQYAVWFGATGSGSSLTPTGSEGKFEFTGQPSVFVVGKGVNEVREMTISFAASVAPELDTSS
jgi:hypothetical protein